MYKRLLGMRTSVLFRTWKRQSWPSSWAASVARDRKRDNKILRVAEWLYNLGCRGSQNGNPSLSEYV